MPAERAESDKIRELEALNLKWEFEVSRLTRENAHLKSVVHQLQNRRIKSLLREVYDRIDAKIMRQIHKLNQRTDKSQPHIGIEYPKADVPRKELLRAAERADLLRLFQAPKPTLRYLVAYNFYVALRNTFLFLARLALTALAQVTHRRKAAHS